MLRARVRGLRVARVMLLLPLREGRLAPCPLLTAWTRAQVRVLGGVLALDALVVRLPATTPVLVTLAVVLRVAVPIAACLHLPVFAHLALLLVLPVRRALALEV